MERLTVGGVKTTGRPYIYVLGFVALAVAGALLALHGRKPPIPGDELARIRELFDATAESPPCKPGPGRYCLTEGYGDVDGDGWIDCWREYRGRAPLVTSRLTIWPQCKESAQVTLEVEPEGITILAIPSPLDQPVWLRWIGDRLLGRDHVACVGFDDCPEPGPEWQWLLDSAEREDAAPGLHGRVPLQWHYGTRPTTGVLILPWVPRGWMEHPHRVEHASDTIATARIIVDLPTTRAPTPAIECGRYAIHAEPRGIVATRGRRWTWLFRGPPDFGGFDTGRLVCADGLVLATERGSHAHVAAIDLATGGWLFEPATDAGSGAALYERADGSHVWRRDNMQVIPLPALAHWLQLEPRARPAMSGLATSARPEIEDPHAWTTYASLGVPASDRRGRTRLESEVFPTTELAPAIRDAFTLRFACGSWQISASPTAVLAERGSFARWLAMTRPDAVEQYSRVWCEAGRVVVRDVGARDRFAERPGDPEAVTLVIDPDAGWWQTQM
ncbi:MAG TPA: hypothetical protein VFQ53_29850 [Kofleriaceae bacterium]|nr:hypothetical protein [Kofleriaceae bacterium]